MSIMNPVRTGHFREIDGVLYQRVFVCELEAGDINTFGERVVSVQRFAAWDGQDRAMVTYDTGYQASYRATATTLIEVTS